MTHHDVVNFVNGLTAKLATRSRHVCLFLGAGSSRACDLPDVAGLQQQVCEALGPEQRSSFEDQLADRNLERALSRLRRIAALIEGDQTIDGLTAADASELDTAVCRLIIERLDLDGASLSPMLKLAAWAARADYHRPLELFTVNYDLLIETALEQLGVPYFDGFVGTLRGRFRTDLVEAQSNDEQAGMPRFIVRVWKLHGSINWLWEDRPRAEVVRLGTSVASGSPAAIYPSDAKYDESRRVPFVVLHDRLRRSLHEPETLVLVAGYSWGDEDLNEIILDAAMRKPRSEFVAFCYSDIPGTLADRAVTTPNLQVVAESEAILGGVRAPWTATGDAPDDVWRDEKFALGDFAALASFLARSSSPRAELDNRLAELVADEADTTGA